MNDYEGFGDARSRNTLSPIREETERVRKTVEFEEKLEELEHSLSWRKVAKCLRWTSVLANTLFILVAVAVMVCALLIFSESRVYIPTLQSYVLAGVGVVFATGALVLCVSSLGLYGSIKPNFYVISLYILAVVPVLVGELALCCIAWFQRGTFRKILDDVIKTVFTHYGDKSTGLGLTATLVIDAVQIWGSCCGNTTSKDWGNSSVAAYWVNSTQKGADYPDSCCNKTTVQDGTLDSTILLPDSYLYNCSQNTVAQFIPDYFNNKGCYGEVTGTVKVYTNWVTAVLFVLAIAQIIVIIVNTLLYLRKHPETKTGIKGKVRRFKNKTIHRNFNFKDAL